MSPSEGARLAALEAEMDGLGKRLDNVDGPQGLFQAIFHSISRIEISLSGMQGSVHTALTCPVAIEVHQSGVRLTKVESDVRQLDARVNHLETAVAAQHHRLTKVEVFMARWLGVAAAATVILTALLQIFSLVIANANK